MPLPPQPDDSHQRLLEELDFSATRDAFRQRLHGDKDRRWKPSQRRNKNTKQMIAEGQRKEFSVIASQENSGTSSPLPPISVDLDDDETPSLTNGMRQSSITQASQNLATLVLEKNLQRDASHAGPAITYSNIESAPSLHPGHIKRYCDITGLPSRYTDPKTRLQYYDKEVFAVIRTLPQNSIDDYLAARGAHFVLK